MLSFGMAVFMLIMFYINFDLSYDNHFANADRLYRVSSKFFINSKEEHFALSSPELGPLLQENVPEIDRILRLRVKNTTYVTIGERVFNEENIFYADTSVFDLFSLKLLAGSNHALHDPNSIVLNRSSAIRYFGDLKSSIGKAIQIDKKECAVNAVVEDMPENTHLRFTLLIPYSQLIDAQQELQRRRSVELWNVSDYTYVLLKPGTKIKAVDLAFPALYDKYMAELGDYLNSSFEPWFQPITSTHFSDNLQYDLPVGNIYLIYGIISIAVSIVVLVILNYSNSAIGMYSHRAKEIGLKKLWGAPKSSLNFQFMTEGLVLCLCAGIMTFLLILVMMHTSILSFIGISYVAIEWSRYLTYSVILLVVLSLLAGVYPSIVLSSTNLSWVLKTKAAQPGSLLFFNVLVVLQFCISSTFIVGTQVVDKQLRLLGKSDVGFDLDRLVVIQHSGLGTRSEPFRNSLSSAAFVNGITETGSVPGNNLGRLIMEFDGNNGVERRLFNLLVVGRDFRQTMEIGLVTGRDFTEADEYSVLINSSAAHLIGDSAIIGKKIGVIGSEKMSIIGVLKDFHLYPPHKRIEPLVLIKVNNPLDYIIANVSPDKLGQFLDLAETTWKKIDNAREFKFFMLKDRYYGVYSDETRYSELIFTFSIVCLLLSITGLISLSIVLNQRMSFEFGIRKVMGATLGDLVWLFYNRFVKLIAIGFLISVPVSLYILSRWLENFDTKVQPDVLSYIATLVICIGGGLATVTYYAYTTAKVNPTKLLRYE